MYYNIKVWNGMGNAPWQEAPQNAALALWVTESTIKECVSNGKLSCNES